MRDLVKQFVDHQISRRDFGRGLVALGLSTAAVESLMAALQPVAQPPPHGGVKVTGTGAEVMIETLRAAGVQYIFGTTATGMSPFFDALAVRDDIHLVLSIAESQATSMAHGYELVTGQTSALFVPGVAIPSAMNNLYNAWKDRSAIAVFSDGASTQMDGRDGFQQMEDWLEPMIQFTKWRWQVNNADQVSEMTRRAIKVAQTPPGGPVHIRLPNNVLGATQVTQTIYPQDRFRVPMDMQPDDDLIKEAARLLLEADSPMICAGAEVTRADANDELVALAEMTGIDVAQGFSVYGDFPFRHDQFAGFYGLGAPRGLKNTDVFLNLGAPMPDPTLFTAPVPRSAKLIHARMEYESIASVYPTDVALAAGMKEIITALIDEIGGQVTESRLKQIRDSRVEKAKAATAKARAAREKKARDQWNASPMSWDRVSAELEDALEDDAIVVPELDYRTPFFWMDLGRNRKWLVGQTTGFALGWGIGAAMGAKVAYPDRQVVCLTGDGSMLFGQVEALWAAARYEIPVIIVVMNNVSYDNERNRILFRSPVWMNPETRDQWKDITCYLGNPDTNFVGLASSFNVPAARADTPDEFRTVLKRAREVTRDGQAFLIDARIQQVNSAGIPVEHTWHPELSIAALRQRKV